MKVYDVLLVRHKARRGPGWHVKPEAEALDGLVQELEVFWRIGDEAGDPEMYRGEWALGWSPRCAPAPPEWCLSWTASGDVEVLELLKPSPLED